MARNETVESEVSIDAAIQTGDPRGIMRFTYGVQDLMLKKDTGEEKNVSFPRGDMFKKNNIPLEVGQKITLISRDYEGEASYAILFHHDLGKHFYFESPGSLNRFLDINAVTIGTFLLAGVLGTIVFGALAWLTFLSPGSMEISGFGAFAMVVYWITRRFLSMNATSESLAQHMEDEALAVYKNPA